jgi:predicted phage-related endonuclease
MKIHTEAQGSPEWLALRSHYFTASEAPAMMGVSKHGSRSELLAAKKSGIAPDVSPATQRIFDQGHAAEAAARVILEELIGEDLFPVVGSSGNLLASMDGMTMMEDVLFEHKLLNQGLVAQIQAGELEPHYYWQLEQQLLVSGAEKVIFVCSDGTADNFHQLEYRPVPGRAEQLLAGWKQFEQDLAEFVPVEVAPAVVGVTPDELPALRIELTGMVTASNLKAFEDSALAVIGAVKTDLQTDQDFADAKKAVKWCGDVEAAVAQAKAQALSQTETIDALFKALDRISANARETRLKVDKMVKAQELSIKVDIKSKAEAAFADHIATINKTLGRLVMPTVATDFAGAMKNKRTLASLRDAVDTELARAKIEANRVADGTRINHATLNELAGNHKFLFADAQQLALKANDDLIAVIKSRINEHESEEKARAEAAAEAKRVADEKAEKDRIEQQRIADEKAVAVVPEPVTVAAEPVTVEPTPVTVTTQPARSEPTAIRPTAKPARRITIVIEAPAEAVHLGMQALGGTVVFAAEGDYSTTIEAAA